jgi:hypothetical protein
MGALARWMLAAAGAAAAGAAAAVALSRRRQPSPPGPAEPAAADDPRSAIDAARERLRTSAATLRDEIEDDGPA